mmetsp:Transcript_18206/g.35940  ORF Transcript_18206/g.35940 Transcript_18206/m.35940 type:complete len:232 (-) Transcript_18206:479-1174(-)
MSLESSKACSIWARSSASYCSCVLWCSVCASSEAFMACCSIASSSSSRRFFRDSSSAKLASAAALFRASSSSFSRVDASQLLPITSSTCIASPTSAPCCRRLPTVASVNVTAADWMALIHCAPSWADPAASVSDSAGPPPAPGLVGVIAAAPPPPGLEGEDCPAETPPPLTSNAKSRPARFRLRGTTETLHREMVKSSPCSGSSAMPTPPGLLDEKESRLEVAFFFFFSER